MMKTALILTMAVGALLALSAPVCAGSAGTSSAQFLKMGAGARAAAMGDSFAAVANDASAVYWNPAGLAQLEDAELTAMQNNGLDNTSYQFAAAARPVGDGAIGVSLYRMDYGSIDSYSAADVRDGSVSAGSLAAGVTAARKFGDNIRLGVTAKMVSEKIAGESASTFAGDAGFLWSNDRLSVGVAVQHFGGTMKFVKKSEDLPMTLRADAALHVSSRILLSAGAAKERDNETEIHAGTEIRMNHLLDVRAGYATVPGNTVDVGGIAGVTGGVGLHLGRFAIDYAIRPFGDLGLSHRISITAHFATR